MASAVNETLEQFLAREDDVLRGLVGRSEQEVNLTLWRLNEQRVELGLPQANNYENWWRRYAFEHEVRAIVREMMEAP